MKANTVILIDNTKTVISKLQKAQIERMTDTMMFLDKQWKKKLSGKRTGRRYKKPGTKDTYYTASAPGEAPAAVLLDLIRSISWKIKKHFVKGIEGIMGSTLDKSVYLEFGTTRIKKRPSLKPVFRENKREIKKRLSKKWL